MKLRKGWLAAASAAFAVSVAALIVATPVGEGPDENAHLFYVRAMQARLELPDIQRLGSHGEAYELHHPPLYYGLAGLWSRLWAAELDYPAIRNPAFPHSKKGGGYLPPEPTAAVLRAHRGVWTVRCLGLLLGLFTVVALARVAAIESATAEAALAAALPFLLAPQLAFLASLVTNDGLLILLSTLCLLAGRQLLDAEHVAWPAAAGVSLLAALTIWTKASGAFLMAPLLLVAWQLWRRRHRGAAVALLVPFASAAAAFFWLWLPRFEVFRGVYGHALGLANHPELLARYPFWWIQLWGSFFAKFTQFQLKLPLALYLLFVPPSLLVALGLWRAWQERRTWSAPALYWSAALLTNLALLVVFMVFVDFQHQGRFLWPSGAAVVALAAIGARFVAERGGWRIRRAWVVGAMVVFFLVNLVGVAVILDDEGWPPQAIWSLGSQ